MIYVRRLPELQEIVREHGGGAFAVSVWLREDGLLIQPGSILFERLARAGRLSEFCELLKENFEEALDNAEKEASRGVRAAECAAECREDLLSCVQVGN